jgi:hypothetical protein
MPDLDDLLNELDNDTAPSSGAADVSADQNTSLVHSETGQLDEVDDNTDILNLKEMINQHSGDYRRVRQNLEIDRAKIDGVIALLLSKVESGDASSAEVESLVKALDVLAKTSDSYVRLLDSKSRLISSTKSAAQTLIQQNFGSGVDMNELEDILQQPDDD